METWKSVLLLAAGLLCGAWRWRSREKRRYRRSVYRAETGKQYKKVEENRGMDGEYRTSLELEKRIRGRRYFVFNAYIPCRSGGSTETDIVMIHEKGIFVIENKNYCGQVRGRANREYWEHILPGKRRTFYNPIYQNQGHVRHLRRLLGEHGYHLPMVSVIVFNDGVKRLRVKMAGSDAILCRSRRAASKINRRLRRMEQVLDEAEMEEVYGILKAQTRPFWWVRYGQRKRAEKLQKKAGKI